MAVKIVIKQKPKAEPLEALVEAAQGPLEALVAKLEPSTHKSDGMHLEASPWELQAAHGIEGNRTGILCQADKGESTYLFRKVTCPRCIAHIALHLSPEYLIVPQWAAINIIAPEGCPTMDSPYRGVDTSKGTNMRRVLDWQTAKPKKGKTDADTKHGEVSVRQPVKATPKPDLYEEF